MKLARWLTTILPAMTLAEAIETTRINSVAGLTGARAALVTTCPCRAPHHTLEDGIVPLPIAWFIWLSVTPTTLIAQE